MIQPRRTQFYVIGAAVLLLLAQSIGTYYLMRQARDAALATAEESVLRVARGVEASVNRNFVQVDAMLTGLPAMLAPLIRDGRLDPSSVSRVLRELINQNFAYRDVVLVGENGLPVATALPVSRRRPLPLAADGPLFSVAQRSGSVMIGGPVRNPATGEWAIFLARRINLTGFGPLLAAAEVPVSLLSSLLASTAGDATGFRMVIEREDGTVLASSPHDETHIGRRLSETAASLAAPGGRVESVIGRFDNEPVLMATRQTLYPSLMISTSVREAAVLADWREDAKRGALVSAGFGALVLALTVAVLLGLRQRDRADAERTRWRTMLDNALESMEGGFVIWDHEDRLVACNSRYREMYAMSAAFITPGATFEEIMRGGARVGQYPQAGEDLDAFLADMDAWHRGNFPPMERLLPDGRWVMITERTTPDGGVVGIRTDITALKRAMAEVAEAAEAKGRFLSRMSHELRTPLNGILGFGQILLADQTLSTEQRRQVEILLSAGRHLLELVNGLLDLSKIDAGKLELEPRPAMLRPLLDGCSALLSPEIARKRQTLRLDVAGGLPQSIITDPTRLRQLLLNLLSNAVKFTPEGGAVILRALHRGNTIRFEVQDSGPGVPAEKRHLLFSDFVQLADRSAEAAGTGLGLSISARLVSLMGGRIGCDSAPGGGAIFWVELPLAAAEPMAQSRALPVPASEPTEPVVGAHVLVVDDLAANRLVAQAMLSAAGHRVASAADGAEALAMVEAGDYDIVLMDLQMPVMDGMESTRRIRALPAPKGNIPILAVTASALPDQVAACREAGMDGHLSKPVDRDGLVREVSRLLSQPRVPRAIISNAEPMLLDETVLAALSADLGGSGGSIIAEFIAEMREVTAMMRSASDATTLRALSHRLVGAARTLGARRLAMTAERLQSVQRVGGDSTSPLQRLLETAAATLPLLEAWLAAHQRMARTRMGAAE
ncbi:signal transduction histidine kinase [Humitalea rosea]|uniref:histidine kinase n=1 Tax=Humitalea rosea TaxID=990373 RepID=A0A2W7IGF1_9PROT|nr:ATP-binding protein [Humitalea rosea]PZW44732.1 signal transduction histidine kinase [Humitalea rosea]